MGLSNLPPGVTDAHPIFNPPAEVMWPVTCEAEEASVVPSYVVKEALTAIRESLHALHSMAPEAAMARLEEIEVGVAALQEVVEELEDMGDYECPFDGEVELPGQTAEAEWTCPTCGTEHKADTIDEGEDPDRGWDDRDDRD